MMLVPINLNTTQSIPPTGALGAISALLLCPVAMLAMVLIVVRGSRRAATRAKEADIHRRVTRRVTSRSIRVQKLYTNYGHSRVASFQMLWLMLWYLPGCKCACCSNNCAAYDVSFAYDGDCDDGGPGAEYSACSSGFDCADCGNRCLSHKDLRHQRTECWAEGSVNSRCNGQARGSLGCKSDSVRAPSNSLCFLICAFDLFY